MTCEEYGGDMRKETRGHADAMSSLLRVGRMDGSCALALIWARLPPGTRIGIQCRVNRTRREVTRRHQSMGLGLVGAWCALSNFRFRLQIWLLCEPATLHTRLAYEHDTRAYTLSFVHHPSAE